jgi:hypothetical protein
VDGMKIVDLKTGNAPAFQADGIALDKILRVLVMLDNPAHFNPRCRYKHPGVAFLLPSTYKVGAIRVSSQKRAVLEWE